MNEGGASGLTTVQARLAEVVTVVYMAVHTGIYGRMILGHMPGPGHGTLLYSAGTAFYIALLYYASGRLRAGNNVWGFTVAGALVVNLVSSSVHLMMTLDLFARPAVYSTASVVAGPIAELYLWSLFIHSFLIEGSRRWRRGEDGNGAAPRILGSGRFRDRWWSTLLTAIVVAVLPVLVLLSEGGTIALDVSDVIVSFVRFWDPLIYIFLFGAYLLLFRISNLPVLKHLAVLFAVAATVGITQLFGASPELVERTGVLGRGVWYGALLLPVLKYYLWLCATREF